MNGRKCFGLSKNEGRVCDRSMLWEGILFCNVTWLNLPEVLDESEERE